MDSLQSLQSLQSLECGGSFLCYQLPPWAAAAVLSLMFFAAGMLALKSLVPAKAES